jgi:hypothetical protein
MPDPIAPSTSTPHTIDLEPVVVMASPTSTASSASLPVGEVAFECSEKVNAAALPLILSTPGSTLAGVLGGLRVGYDLGACLAKSKTEHERELSQQQAEATCVANGGTPVGVLGDTLSCVVVKP